MKEAGYPGDLNDASWSIIERYVRPPERRGPESQVDLRQVVNGCF